MTRMLLLPTTVIGSCPQPAWLTDRERLAAQVTRVPMCDHWHVDQHWLDQARDDATLLAMRDMERAGTTS